MDNFLKRFNRSGESTLAQSNDDDIEVTAAKKEKKKLRHVPWVEKYRPRTVEEVAYQEEAVAVLIKAAQGADLPNLLLYGPPGTGKTSTALALARDLFGAELLKDRLLELNASDERGIQVVREKVKRFAQLAASSGRVRADGRACPAFKLIVLDEADSMTHAAQSALRRTMEKESKTTRFCLICNYVTRIIEPIASRCAKFRFKPLSRGIAIERLRHISDAENVLVEDAALDTLVDISGGDLRRAITFLQSTAGLYQERNISVEHLEELSGRVAQPLIVKFLRETLHSGNYDDLDAAVNDFLMEGRSGYQLLEQLHDAVLDAPDVADLKKAVILEKIAVADRCLLDGADEYLQLMAVGTTAMQQLCR